MKLIILVFGLCLIASLDAVPQTFPPSQFIHGDLATIGGYPAVGIGLRAQHGRHGVDIAGRACFMAAHSAKALYLYYPKNDGLYLGIGPGYVTNIETRTYGEGIANGVIGWQKKTRKGKLFFIQAESSTFVREQKPLARTYPSLSLGFGF